MKGPSNLGHAIRLLHWSSTLRQGAQASAIYSSGLHTWTRKLSSTCPSTGITHIVTSRGSQRSSSTSLGSPSTRLAGPRALLQPVGLNRGARRISTSHALFKHESGPKTPQATQEFEPVTIAEDPTQPGRRTIYYHLLPSTLHPLLNTEARDQTWGLSFLPQHPINYTPTHSNSQPSTSRSSNSAELHPTLLGTLSISPGAEGPSLESFVQNTAFVDTLHRVVKEGLLEDADEEIRNEALVRVDGWMSIYDRRNPPPINRVPEPCDTIGMILVEGGKIKPETYEPMMSYRVVTDEGVVWLPKGLEDRLVRALEDLLAEP